MTATGSEAPVAPDDLPDRLLRHMMARHDMTENLYKRMEEHLPCEPMSDEMLARMNASLGFSGEHAKTREYRPYCVRKGCSTMPRMMRSPEGFRCWQCGNIWDLRKEIENHATGNEVTKGE